MVRLNPEQTIILIRLIKKYDFLWNPKSPFYKDRDKVQATYNKIGSYFQASGSDIKIKFRRLRCAFRIELAKISTNGKNRSNLFYFDEMEFLRDLIVRRKQPHLLSEGEMKDETSGSLVEGEADDDEVSFITEEVANEEDFSQKGFINNESEPSENYLEDPAEVNHQEDHQFDSIEEEEEEACTEVLVDADTNEKFENDSFTSLNTIPSQTKDEFDCFGTYIACQLRKMDQISAMETMTDLQKLISFKRIDILKQKETSGKLSFSSNINYLERKRRFSAFKNAARPSSSVGSTSFNDDIGL